jgi:hypothetical protein
MGSYRPRWVVGLRNLLRGGNHHGNKHNDYAVNYCAASFASSGYQHNRVQQFGIALQCHAGGGYRCE